MRICFVGMEIVPTNNGTFVGGLVNNVVRLAKGLSERGNEVHIITTDINNVLEGGASFPWGDISPIQLHGEYASSRSGIEFLLKVMPTVLEEDSEESFDIVHVHSAYPLLAPIGSLSALIRHIPAVFSLYSPMQTTPLKDRRGIYQTLSSLPMSRFLFKNVGRILAPSENVETSLLKIGVRPDRISRLPPIVDSAFLDESPHSHDKREELGISRDAPIILYIGNWAKWKGADILIDSMTGIRREFPNVKLVTAWGEPYSWYDDGKLSLDRRIEKLGLGENIVQVGIVKDLPCLIGCSDVVALPFLNTDGVADLPLTILESMACGKPVVSTRVGGIPEIVDGSTGLLVTPGDSTELSSALIYVLTHESDANQMGSLARDFVMKNHNSDVIIDKLMQAYNAIIDA